MVVKAPFPWFGGKASVAPEVWAALGDPPNYVEPFFGSGAALLARPNWSPEVTWTETVNDADGWVSNFWRAVQAAPEEVTQWADWPVNENDLHARHAWLKPQGPDLRERLEGDPDFYDAKLAGWWVWGQCCWIGSGWCGSYSDGPWEVQEIEGERRLVKRNGSDGSDGSVGSKRQQVHLGNAGGGVNRNLVHLGNAGRGVNRNLVHLGDAGRGVNRQRVHLGDAGRGGVHRSDQTDLSDRSDYYGNDPGSGECGLYAWMEALSQRLRRVRVASGDWGRVMGPTVTTTHGLTGIFLDPPYSEVATRSDGIYTEDSISVAHDVREWCLANGDNPLLKIVLCGYEGEHEELAGAGWTSISWKAHGGYSNRSNGQGRLNAHRERLWLSPHCLRSIPIRTLFEFSEEEEELEEALV